MQNSLSTRGSQNLSAQVAPPTKETPLGQYIVAERQLCEVADNAALRLAGLCERLRGSVPEAVGEKSEAPRPNGSLGALEVALSETHGRLAAASKSLEELERLL